MPFEAIEFVGAVPASTVPTDGVRISSRAAMKGSRYIVVQLGTGLAKKLCLQGENTSLAVAFGTGRDAGLIGISVDMSSGRFPAKRSKKGGYGLTINARTVDGLFALDFPAFTVPDVEVRSEMGKPPMAVLKASEEMLAVAD